MTHLELFQAHRHYLFGIAYRMLGSVMEAEDMLQETWLRFETIDLTEVDNPRAFLARVVSRLCLDQLKSARNQREAYIGPWLPEPLPTESDNPAWQVVRAEALSMAFLVLLEQLSPAERAVFLLREVFDYDYADIGRILDKDEAACRQLLSRAKKHLRTHRPRYEPSAADHTQIVQQFRQAAIEGDLQGLTNLLAEGVTLVSDGGGKVAAAQRPLIGREMVLRFLQGLNRLKPTDAVLEIVTLNGEATLLTRIAGQVDNVIALETLAGHIHAIRIVRNPDKLRHLQS